MIKFHRGLLIVFAACFIYWSYLCFNAHMLIRYDAVGYQELGTMIHDKGWQAFFKAGPNREPFYPLMVSWSLDISQHWGVSFEMVQKIMQVSMILMAQLLMLVLMGKMNIRLAVQAVVILYVGFSPALINSAFSLFSEIATYPFVLLIIYSCVESWRVLSSQQKFWPIVSIALLTAVAFLGATVAKGIFQYIFLVAVIFWVAAAIVAWMRQRKQICFNIIIYLIVSVVAYNSAVISFKLANARYNGHFVFTDRFSDLLYGNAVKRSKPLTGRIFIAHLTSIPGGGVCRRFFSDDECRYCEFNAADEFRGVVPGLIKGVPAEKVESTIIHEAWLKAKERPFQYVLFMGIEGLRMFFWESTQIGFVIYPEPLQKLFGLSFFKDGLRLIVSLLTMLAFIAVIADVYRRRRCWAKGSGTQGDVIRAVLIATILVYIGLHSLFSIVTRYALPIAPLYLLCIAHWIDTVWSHKTNTQVSGEKKIC